ncbi:MAG TPA: glutaredoxin family protein [Verrucomicrobiae bacterium]|nr:glutaredoxin family protein [Verrucomicrobiae bacterium]
MHRIVIYSNLGCHLCDRAKEVLDRCQRQVAFEVEVVDISQNPELLARYGQDIPVILLDGREVARHFVRERKLLELLQHSIRTAEEPHR